MRNNPHILEINARSWLARYEREQGRKFTLADVPAAFWEKIQEAGFDAVWLMGVWKLSTVAEKIARENEEILNQVRTSKPNFKTEDIAASPYAVYDYTVDEFFGGNEALAAFRKNLNDRGIQLFYLLRREQKLRMSTKIGFSKTKKDITSLMDATPILPRGPIPHSSIISTQKRVIS